MNGRFLIDFLFLGIFKVASYYSNFSLIYFLNLASSNLVA